MPIEYQYDPSANFVKCIASGALQIDDIIDYFDDLLNSGFKPGCVEFADMSKLSVIYISYRDNKRLTRAYRRLVDKGYLGTVIYAPQKLTRSIFDALSSAFAQDGMRLLVVGERQEVDAALEDLRQHHRPKS